MNISIFPGGWGPKWGWPVYNPYRYTTVKYIEIKIAGYRVTVYWRYPTWRSHSCSPLLDIMTRSGARYKFGKPYCQDGKWHRGHGQWSK